MSQTEDGICTLGRINANIEAEAQYNQDKRNYEKELELVPVKFEITKSAFAKSTCADTHLQLIRCWSERVEVQWIEWIHVMHTRR